MAPKRAKCPPLSAISDHVAVLNLTPGRPLRRREAR